MDSDNQALTVRRAAKGGDARAAKLSKEERSAIAKTAADSRWGANLPQATHDGPMVIGDSVIVAANLSSGKRLLTQGSMLEAIGRSRTAKGGTGGLTGDALPAFLQAEVLKPFISEELMLATTPILFRLRSGQKAVGYDALLLPMVCEVYLNLRDSLHRRIADGDASEKRQARGYEKQYRHIIEKCDQLMRGFAKRGILALVDDATGYQADKTREEIERIIQAYVAPGLLPWTRKFPHEFFKEACRILKWEYKPGQTKHPSYMGKFINKYVFEALPPGVLEELKRQLPKNEHGNRRAKLWQKLTADTGIPHLDKQLTADITLMQISDDKEQFEMHWERVFGKQPRLPLTMPKELKA